MKCNCVYIEKSFSYVKVWVKEGIHLLSKQYLKHISWSKILVLVREERML